MNSTSAGIAALNSLLFIRDETARDVPHIDGRGAVWSIPSCIAVGCLPHCDGDTFVEIGTPNELHESGKLIFDGPLSIPSGLVTVTNVLGDVGVSRRVSPGSKRIKVWTDGNRDTKKVIVEVSSSRRAVKAPRGMFFR